MTYWTPVLVRIIDQARDDCGHVYSALRDENGHYFIETPGEPITVFRWECEEVEDETQPKSDSG